MRSRCAKSHRQTPGTGLYFSSNIANPLGSLLADEEKKQIVALLESRNIPLIEDEVYGDLYFSGKRGAPAQRHTKKGLVLTCNSFSKTVAPGYRIGWIAAPRFIDECGKIKRALSCSSLLANQWALHEFIRGGEYDRYFNRLRQILLTNKERMRSQIQQHFMANIRVRPGRGRGAMVTTA